MPTIIYPFGTPTEITFPAAALGTASGRIVPFNNAAPIIITSGTVSITASATVGNRIITVQFVDTVTSKTVARVASSVTQTAGTTGFYTMGAGLTPSGSLGVLSTILLPIPFALTLPAFSQIQIFDSANIDVADTSVGTIFAGYLA